MVNVREIVKVHIKSTRYGFKETRYIVVSTQWLFNRTDSEHFSTMRKCSEHLSCMRAKKSIEADGFYKCCHAEVVNTSDGWN
jgi:hypothetical protein